MNPLLKKKIDVNSLSPREQEILRRYGKLPTQSDHFAKQQKDRKFFDSVDYALSRESNPARSEVGNDVGVQHPSPQDIPHPASTTTSPTPAGQSPFANVQPLKHVGLPGTNKEAVVVNGGVKEASLLAQETKPENVVS